MRRYEVHCCNEGHLGSAFTTIFTAANDEEAMAEAVRKARGIRIVGLIEITGPSRMRIMDACLPTLRAMQRAAND